MRSLLIHMHHAESGCFGARHLDAAHGDVGLAFDVLTQHRLVVHLVDVVARQDDQVFGAVACG